MAQQPLFLNINWSTCLFLGYEVNYQVPRSAVPLNGGVIANSVMDIEEHIYRSKMWLKQRNQSMMTKFWSIFIYTFDFVTLHVIFIFQPSQKIYPFWTCPILHQPSNQREFFCALLVQWCLIVRMYFLFLEMLIPIYIDESILLHNIYWIKWCFHIKLQHALQYLCPLVSVFTLDSCQQINFSISSTWPRATVDISSNL